MPPTGPVLSEYACLNDGILTVCMPPCSLSLLALADNFALLSKYSNLWLQESVNYAMTALFHLKLMRQTRAGRLREFSVCRKCLYIHAYMSADVNAQLSFCSASLCAHYTTRTDSQCPRCPFQVRMCLKACLVTLCGIIPQLQNTMQYKSLRDRNINHQWGMIRSEVSKSLIH